MNQPEKLTEFVYPFGNPQPSQQEDAESYHSLTTDDQKLRYFDDNQQSSFSKKASESMIRKRNLLPPVYPYEEMKKLKQSMRLQHKKDNNQSQTNVQFETQSIRSVDSFHTANQFQSICYEEGDYEKIVGEMKQQQTRKKIDSDQRLISERLVKSKIEMQQSDALNEAQLEELQGNRSQKIEQSLSIYDRFEQSTQKRHQQQNQTQKISQNAQQQHQKQQQQQQQPDQDKSVQISQIEKVLNESIQVDNEILQLTKQLEKAQSQEELILGNLMKGNHEEWNKKRQQLIEKYDMIAKRIDELQQGQKFFTAEIAGMTNLIKKTQENNLYLKKQVEFFKQKSNEYQYQKERQEQKFRKEIKEQNDLNTSNVSKTSDRQGLWREGSRKNKTYHISPKAPANQSYQSRKYKQLTFEYCFGTMRNKSDQQWNDLQVDRQNNPAQYKLVYSFQQENTLLVLRVVDTPTSQPQLQVRKNYQYMIDFASNKYPTRQQKMQSLSKELIVHLEEGVYCWKEFTKKIEVFLIITEDQVSVDLVRILPLPNPIVFYVEERFGSLEREKNKIVGKTEIEDKAVLQKEKRNVNSIMYKNLQNLHKLMRTYIIKIQRMADINSIQKLITLPWVNNTSDPQPKYFSIRNKQQSQSQNQARNQLFYLKIDNCVLQSKNGKEDLDEENRYSLTFRVASNIDNALIVDMIEFLTFLTVM